MNIGKRYKFCFVSYLTCLYIGDEERQEHGHHVQLAQTFFPSSICAVVLPIIHLLEDGEVGDDGVAGITVQLVSPKLKLNQKSIMYKCDRSLS